MKFSVLTVMAVLCSNLSASTLKSGVTLSNLPTASKSYVKSGLAIGDLPAAKLRMQEDCKRDMNDTLHFIARTNGTVLTKDGCVVSEKIGTGNCDQGGCDDDNVISSDFKILFK